MDNNIINLDQFETLISQGYNRIPLIKEILADLETPLSTYIKIAKGPYSYLFESVQGTEKWGRYSFIGLPCQTVIKVTGQTISVFNDNEKEIEINTPDPLTWIHDFQDKFKVPELRDMPRFNGGLVGFFGYDIIRTIEPKLADSQPEKDPLDIPDIILMVSNEFIVFDRLLGKLSIVVIADPFQNNSKEIAVSRLETIEHQLKSSLASESSFTFKDTAQTALTDDYELEFPEQDYKEAVEKIKSYITDGEAMQVVLSQRMTKSYRAPALNLYRALRYLNPSPYHFYLNLDDTFIVGSSPEILVRKEEDQVTVRPIAGTRKRGQSEQEDLELELELLSDEKERAEHLMLIDLGRNDIGRVCKPGSVKLTEQYVIERYSHVMHIVSNVIGEIQPDLSSIDVLKACFPAGTVSGAPKVRAMEIIDELEPIKRSVYSGAVGYISWSDNMDVAIAIRTAIIKDEKISIQAGGGVVYDSTPDFEWQESLNKGKVILKAVALAEKGLKHE